MKRRIVVGLVCVVVALVALWWWTRDRRTATNGSESAAGDQATPVERARQREGDLGGPLPPIIDDDDPRGNLRLEGQVVDAQSRPVEGAVVGLSSSPARTATTEADGAFVFDGLVARRYTLVARAKLGIAGPITASLTATTEPIVMRLRAGGAVAVSVVGPDAKPIDGATVELRGIDNQSGFTVKGEVTFAPIVPGMYEVVASAPGMARAYQPARVTGETRLRIMLATGAAVEGHVVDDGGKAISGARVLAAPAGQFRQQGDARLDAVTTRADGSFAFDALPAGSFRFGATHPEHAPGTSKLVTLDGVSKKIGIVVTLTVGATVRGHVVDVAKQPVAGARVQIVDAGFGRGQRGPANRRGSPPRQTFSDATGAFEMHGLPKGELLASASHDRGASTNVPVDTTAGNVADLVLALDLTMAITGVVVDPTGNPIEGAQVSATPQRAGTAGSGGGGGGFGGGGGGGGGFGGVGGMFGRNTEVSDGSGRFKVTGLAAGHYVVRANRGAMMQGRGRRAPGGVEADAGATDVRIILPAEGGIKAKVAFADGSPPAVVVATLGSIEQSFVGGNIALDGIPPGDYTLEVRGTTFDTKGADVTIESGKTADAGTITVAQGRRLAGLVEANGSPVGGATVYAGRRVMGTGSTNSSPGTGLDQGTKSDTTGPDGSFSLAGFGDGDLTIVAELPSIGRSKAMLVAQDATNQSQLVLELQSYGSISGVLHQDPSAAGVAVTAQSTTTPGAMYVVNAGGDGAYRFDRLAPDTYKVSATLGSPRRGIHFYSKQVDVPPGGNVTIDLTVDAGNVTLAVTPQPTSGAAGTSLGWLASTPIAVTTARALTLSLAAAGPGSSQFAVAREGNPASFTLVAPGAYTACIVPLPSELQAFQAMAYMDRHSGTLPAFCQAVTVQPSPTTQAASIPVTVPPLIDDGGGKGSGR